jgi:RHS repeat-associated protein
VILDADGTTTGVINDQFGNGVASVSGGSVTWYTTRVGAYGPLPGIQAQTLTDVTQLAAATAWRSHRIDPTGFYWLGARYYEPTSGRFLSADPMGQAASPSLYDYAGGDPVNGMDPDGRDQVFMIWTTKNGDPGHSATAVSKYDSGGTHDTGAFEFYEFGPAQGTVVGESNFSQNVPGSYGNNSGKLFTLQNLQYNYNSSTNQPISGWDQGPPDVVVVVHTTQQEDQDFLSGIKDFKNNTSSYNGVYSNCTDLPLAGLQKSIDGDITASEQIGPFSVSTPNTLYKTLQDAFPDATILGQPGPEIDQSYIDGIDPWWLPSKWERMYLDHVLNDAASQSGNQQQGNCPNK